jgi:predicted DNA-binding transcriptional regulator AlpA
MMQLKTENLPHILTRAQVKQRTGLSDGSIDALMSNGDFPDPISFREHPDGWLDHEVQDWIRGYVDATRGGAR